MKLYTLIVCANQFKPAVFSFIAIHVKIYHPVIWSIPIKLSSSPLKKKSNRTDQNLNFIRVERLISAFDISRIVGSPCKRSAVSLFCSITSLSGLFPEKVEVTVTNAMCVVLGIMLYST